MRKLCFILPIALAIGACAGPAFQKAELSSGAIDAETGKQAAALLQHRYRQIERLQNVAYPILRDGTELCGEKVARSAGFIAATASGFSDAERDAATEAFGLGSLPVVITVVRESPAWNAGLRPGDTIVSFDGLPIRTGDTAWDDFDDKVTVFNDSRSEVFALGIRRGGKPDELSIRPDILCDYPVRYMADSMVNASADGTVISVAAGMMRFAETDDELAIVIGHELAHNTMRHIQKRHTNYAVGTFAGLALDVLAAAAGVNTQGAFSNAMGDIGGQAWSQDFESEADYVGLHFVARAGYRIEPAVLFWRRMGAERRNVNELHVAHSHPTSAERFLRMEKAAAEIQTKIAAGLPLIPELKGEAPWLKKEPAPVTVVDADSD
ncbi:MAG: M48 family metallopeptidase [Alphaproteobacteria bacterium]